MSAAGASPRWARGQPERRAAALERGGTTPLLTLAHTSIVHFVKPLLRPQCQAAKRLWVCPASRDLQVHPGKSRAEISDRTLKRACTHPHGVPALLRISGFQADRLDDDGHDGHVLSSSFVRRGDVFDLVDDSHAGDDFPENGIAIRLCRAI